MSVCRVILLLLLLPGSAAAETLDALLARLTATGQGLRTLQANFLQRKRLALFRSEVKTRGRVIFRRPNHLRWETFAPDASLLLVRGAAAELRLPGEKPRLLDLRREGGMGVLVEQIFIWLGVRPARELTRQYKVELQRGGAGPRLRLSPRGGPLASRVRTIELELSTDLSLRRIEVSQRDGDSTVIELSAIRRNAPLPPWSFR